MTSNIRRLMIAQRTSADSNALLVDANLSSSEPNIKTCILKKSLTEFCAETTIHGLKYFVGSNRHWIEKVWWVITFNFALVWCCLSIYNIWIYWISQPVAIELHNKVITISSIPFPAVTICPTPNFDIHKINMDSFMAMGRVIEANKSALMSFSPDMINELDVVQNMCLRDMANWPDDLIIPRTESIYNTIRKIQPDMTSVILQAYFLNKPTIMKPILGERGLCYTFNSINSRELYTDEISPDLITVDGNPKSSWSTDNGYAAKLGSEAYPYRVFDSSTRNSFFVSLAIRSDDLNQLCNALPPGLRLILHSPDHLPPSTYDYIFLSSQQETLISLKPKVLFTSNTLRTFSPADRGCYFESERKLRFFQTYTQWNCARECAANKTKVKCGCVTFSKPRDNQTKVCTLAQRKCYRTTNAETMGKIFSNDCSCLPGCNEISYETQISQIPKLTRFVDNGMNYTNIILISFRERNFIPLHRKETCSLAHFIANCGGLLGLFMGISVLSLIEIIYYFTLRLVFNIRQWKSINPITTRTNPNQVFVIHN